MKDFYFDFKPVEDLLLNKTKENELILLLVIGEGCEKQYTTFEAFLRDAITEIQSELEVDVHVARVCFTDSEMPFPRPMTPAIYYFKHGQLNYLFMRFGREAIHTLKQDIDIATKIIGGMTYAEAVYDNEEDKKLIEDTETELNKSEKELKYPETSKMLRGFAKEMWESAKYVGKGLPVLANSDVAAERYSICQECPNLTETGRCKECGCFMKKKVYLNASSCPIGKWEAVV